MKRDTHRLHFCLLASALAHALILPLAARFWQPADFSMPVPPARITLFTVIMHHVPQTHLVIRKKPITPAIKPIPPPKREVLRPKLGVHVPTHRVELHLNSTGGASALAPAPLLATAVPMSAPRLAVTGKPSPVMIPQLSRTPLSLAPTSLTAIAPASNTTYSLDVDAASQREASSGEGKGNGKGAGSNSGANGDVGEPFGVGAGLSGNGGVRHVVYVLDISGSMTSRIDRAEAELHRALNGLGPRETFNIIAFSDRVQQFDTTMAPASAETEKQANRFLATLQVSGGTNLEAAMTQALILADVNEVIVLTDGVPTLGETNFDKLARRIRALNKSSARISAVGLIGRNPDGTDDSFAAEGLLRQMAQDSGGACELVTLGTAAP